MSGTRGFLRAARDAWSQGRPWAGLPGDALAFAIADMAGEAAHLIVVDEPDAAARLARGIRFFMDKPSLVEVYPADDVRPYDGFSPSPRVVGSRARVLHRLHEGVPLIVVAPARALLQRVPDASSRAAMTVQLREGDVLDRDDLVRRLTETGYLASDRVDRPGFFAVRGDVVDVWSIRTASPRRIDFFDDEIESVRELDVRSQRGGRPLRRALVLPAREEWLSDEALRRCQRELGRRVGTPGYDPKLRRRVLDELRSGIRFSGVEDYLPALVSTEAPLDALGACRRMVVFPGGVSASLREAQERVRQRWEQLEGDERPLVPPEDRYVPVAEVQQALADAHEVYELGGPDGAVSLGARPVDGLAVRGADLAPVVSRLGKLLSKDVRLALIARDARRADALEQLLSPHGLTLVGRSSPFDARPGEASLLIGDLPRGFIAEKSGWAMVPASALFGGRESSAASRRANAFFDVSVSAVSDLKEDDYVVHRTHGIGKFIGLFRLEVSTGAMQDFIQLEYRGGDRMYLPATSLAELSKYTATKSSVEIKLDRLGGQTWTKRKGKVRDALLRHARGLLDLHAKRQLVTREPVGPPGAMYRAFEAKFPHQETEDQAQAILDVEADLLAAEPMDRLVCGDVGFGKTEVAMRAAMRVVAEGRQVAVLCPTTVLALQHYNNFRERFADFPVRVGMMSRFTSAADAKRLTAAARDGTVDIVVGTHRLLGRSLRFKNLGLVVVDEEHRFGVSQKNRLRKMRTEVDMLAMSATPIPRTLQMALSGVRSMSIMATPPHERLAVRTMTARMTRTRVRDALLFELERQGQAYFVHNRIESIEVTKRRLEEWVPEARFRVAHGQMSGEELETILVSFIRREFDVLVCTAIVESGVDLPNVNTMIIDRADMFGLSQLYQLRGRVGRSAIRGNCLLLTPDKMNKDARRRLQVLVENTRLGSGFAIAAADLEQRGGGNLLGASQSGHIDAVGYDVWVTLLEEAVRAAQGHAERDQIEPEVKVPVAAFVSEALVPDVQHRMAWYRRFASCQTEAQADEVVDAFRVEVGEIPEEITNLSELTAAKLACRELGVVRCDWHRVRVRLELHSSAVVSQDTLDAVVRKHPKRFAVERIGDALVLGARFTPAESQRPLRYVRWVLSQLRQALRATGA